MSRTIITDHYKKMTTENGKTNSKNITEKEVNLSKNKQKRASTGCIARYNCAFASKKNKTRNKNNMLCAKTANTT